eukprot:4090539-Pleurochrysis_carterae.AAC.5
MRSSSRQTRTPTTSTTVTLASTPAASVAARLAGAASADVGSRRTWATSGLRRRRITLRWRPLSIVVDGCMAYANQGKADADVVLYWIVWRDYPPDMVSSEPGCDLGSEYEKSLAEEAAADLASAIEDAEIVDLEMPDVKCARPSTK